MARKNGKGKVYTTRYGNVRVVRVKGGKTVQMDPKGNLLRVKTA